jgi:predicted Zn-dependent peptidase
MKKSDFKIPAVEMDWKQLALLPFESKTYANGARIYQIPTSKPGLCGLEMVFRNGRIREHKKLSCRMTAQQLQESNKEYDARQVADLLDFYGAGLSIHADADFTLVQLSCLQKHFKILIEFLSGLLLNPAFRESDLDKAKVFISSMLQHQLIEPDYLSYREFTAALYGKDSVYGYNTTPALIADLNTADLRQYHQENYVSDHLELFYCGEINKETEKILEELVLQFRPSDKIRPEIYRVDPGIPDRLHFPIEHAAQISLKLGLRSIPKKHPDFFGLYLLNTILGDYFGSRLMKNLREDKGYTYDIHSSLDSQVYDGCFYISAELNSDQINDAIDCIIKEVDKLRGSLIPDKELSLVKNYLCGNVMRQMDGSFQTIVFLRILVAEYGSPEVFQSFLQSILEADPVQLRQLAIDYLDPGLMIQCTAGA